MGNGACIAMACDFWGRDCSGTQLCLNDELFWMSIYPHGVRLVPQRHPEFSHFLPILLEIVGLPRLISHECVTWHAHAFTAPRPGSRRGLSDVRSTHGEHGHGNRGREGGREGGREDGKGGGKEGRVKRRKEDIEGEGNHELSPCFSLWVPNPSYSPHSSS